MSGCHHWLDGRESEWTPGVSNGEGGLACCDLWGRRVGQNWTTELNWCSSNLLRRMIPKLLVSLHFLCPLLGMHVLTWSLLFPSYQTSFGYSFDWRRTLLILRLILVLITLYIILYAIISIKSIVLMCLWAEASPASPYSTILISSPKITFLKGKQHN